MILRTFAFALPVAAMALSPSVMAQTSTPVATPRAPDTQVGPYRALVDVFQTEDMAEALFQQQLRDLKKMWLADAGFALEEKRCPGLVDALVTDLTPMLREADQKANRQLKNAFVGIFAANLTEQEAIDARDFFLSDDGQLILSTVVGNFTFENLAADTVATDEGTITKEALDRDRAQTVQRTMAELDVPTMLRIGRVFRNSTWGPKLTQLRPQMDQARLTILNAPFTPEEDKAFGDAFLQSYERHIATCD